MTSQYLHRVAGWMVGELDKGESGSFPGALYELRVICPRHLNCNREDLGKRWPT
jgi:hypothetical protein